MGPTNNDGQGPGVEPDQEGRASVTLEADKTSPIAIGRYAFGRSQPANRLVLADGRRWLAAQWALRKVRGATHDNLNKAIAKYAGSPPSRSASQKLDPN